MTVMAAEDAAPIVAGAAGQAGQSKGTMLAIAILLFWLAGVCFFIAFESSGILGENPPTDSKGGASWFKAALGGLTSMASDAAGGDTGSVP